MFNVFQIFGIFNNPPPESWVAKREKGFLTHISRSNISFMLKVLSVVL